MTSPAAHHIEPGGNALVANRAEDLRSLLRIPLTWSVLGWWTLGYGLLSWLVEWFVSGFGRAEGRIPFWFGLNRMVYAIVWGGAILAAIALTEWRPVSRLRQPGRIAFHLIACVVMTIVWGVAAYYACLAVVPGWVPLGVAHMLSTTSKNVLFGYGLVTVLVHIVWRVRLYRAQEVAMLRRARLATEAQLQVLKMELQPHFLFNALHSISALIPRDPDAANETLVRLSDLLRHSMETARIQEVPLRQELGSLRLYTQIEKVRFGDRLDIRWAINNDTLDAAVPHMLLQPLVENAIKHGLEVQSTSGRIDIAAEQDGDRLRLTIRDDGPGLEIASGRAGGGLGLANTRARLEELYGDRHAFALTSCPGEGTQVTIRLPFVALPTADAQTRADPTTWSLEASASAQHAGGRAETTPTLVGL